MDIQAGSRWMCGPKENVENMSRKKKQKKASGQVQGSSQSDRFWQLLMKDPEKVECRKTPSVKSKVENGERNRRCSCVKGRV